MEDNGKQQRIRWIAGNILIFLSGLAVTLGAIVKFAGVPGVVQTMATAGFSGGKLTFVAALELLSGSLFLLPRTRSFGLLMLSAFLGGAICSHVQVGEYAKGIGPSLILSLAWVGTWLRHPQALWNADGGRPVKTQFVSEKRPESWAS